MRAKTSRRRAAGRSRATRKGKGAATRRAPAGRRRARPKTNEDYVMETARLFAALDPNLMAANLDSANDARRGRGRPLACPPLMIGALGVMRVRPGMTFRFLAGVGRAMCPWADTLRHTTLERRIVRIDLSAISSAAGGSRVGPRECGVDVVAEAGCKGGRSKMGRVRGRRGCTSLLANVPV